MKHFLFQQLILCIFYGIIPWILISWYISKNQKEFDKEIDNLHIATENLKSSIIESFQLPKNKAFYIVMGVALIVILIYPFK